MQKLPTKKKIPTQTTQFDAITALKVVSYDEFLYSELRRKFKMQRKRGNSNRTRETVTR